ncbi:unnamed protein product [Amaranthus hypochondriacus]
MGGPAVARGRGRPRKEAAKVVEPPMTASEPSTPCNEPSKSVIEDGGMNPNLSTQINLGILNTAVESGHSRLSWASVVLGTPARSQQSAEEEAVACLLVQQRSSVTEEGTKDAMRMNGQPLQLNTSPLM